MRGIEPDPRSPNAPSRVLLIRPSALGDVARTVPVLVSLRRAWPEARIDWLVDARYADVVAQHPMLDGVVPFARNGGLRAWLGLVGRLRDARYDRVYDLQGLLRSGLFARLSGAARRVGFADAREGGWLGYNVRHRVDPTVEHTVDRMLALIEADGVEPVRDLRLHVGEHDRAWAGDWLNQQGWSDGFACVAPTAQWLCKCWPIERYAEVAKRLDRPIVVLAAPHEAPQVQPLLKALGDRATLPRTSVGQLMALIERTQLLLCNDSAALHIAVGLDRPVVALFGPTDPRKVGPYRRDDTVIQPPDTDSLDFDYRKQRDDQTIISKIAVQTVWEKLKESTASPQ